ncbi:MAG: hypothetical protein WDZ84_01665 [Rhodovibrionaceae bacterium]
MAKEREFQPGWLDSVFKAASQEIEAWPDGMKRLDSNEPNSQLDAHHTEQKFLGQKKSS